MTDLKGNKPWLIYFSSGNYWNGSISGRHHILKRLSKDYNIMFVNSMGLASIKKVKKNTILKRIYNKLSSYLRYIKKDKEFTIYSPISIPLGLTSIEKFNSAFIKFQFKLVFKLLGVKRFHLMVSQPKAYNLLSALKYDKMIYMYSDKFTSYREISDKSYILDLDAKLKDKSDFIISQLRRSYEELSEVYGDKVKYLPHSVDFNLFNSYLDKDIEKPEDLKNIPSPIVGYYGTLTDSNNWDMMENVVKNRPNYNFVFIGKEREDIKKSIYSYDNVHFLGWKDYKELPKYLKFFDACIMFWKVTDWIYNSNPLKTKEFLAMGKPVVSVNIYEVEKNFGDIIHITETEDDFILSLDKALKEDTEELRQKRIDRVKNDSWESDAEKIKQFLES